MHESSVNDTVREVPDPGVVLEECRSKNWNMWLVLDPGCHPQALAKLYATEPDAEKTLLFFDSPLEHMHELSPRIAAVLPESPMLDWLERHNPPGWGMVVASDAQAGDVLAHLRSLLLVKTKGEDVIFRIWDGRILSRICKAMDEEIPALLGPARLVLTRMSEGAWMRIDHESHKADAPRIVHPAILSSRCTGRIRSSLRRKRLETSRSLISPSAMWSGGLPWGFAASRRWTSLSAAACCMGTPFPTAKDSL